MALNAHIPNLVKNTNQTPLNTSWTLYLDLPSNNNNTSTFYCQNLIKIYKITTIELFWQVFNNIPKIKNLPYRATYHLMRNDIQPKWEDEYNVNGGIWKFKCHKKVIEKSWLELAMATVGEQFHQIDDICGISVSQRGKINPLQIWTRNAKKSENEKFMLPELVEEKIKANIKNFRHFDGVFYQSHAKKINEDYGFVEEGQDFAMKPRLPVEKSPLLEFTELQSSPICINTGRSPGLLGDRPAFVF